MICKAYFFAHGFVVAPAGKNLRLLSSVTGTSHKRARFSWLKFQAQLATTWECPASNLFHKHLPLVSIHRWLTRACVDCTFPLLYFARFLFGILNTFGVLGFRSLWFGLLALCLRNIDVFTISIRPVLVLLGNWKRRRYLLNIRFDLVQNLS